MADVYVRNNIGIEFYVDERIARSFPDDYQILDDPKTPAAGRPAAPTAAPTDNR